MMNTFLQVRDPQTGEWIGIPALVGPQGPAGKDAEITFDDTLTQANMAADAKAVGDAIAALGQKSQIQIIAWEEND